MCPVCSSRFSGDARFCPFDGEALVVAEDRPSDRLLGTVVDDRYRIVEVLGEGGMGTVYAVEHVQLGRPFAMKVLRADLASEETLGTRFTREARAAARVGHPNVVQITDFGALASGQPYFVMERLEGESLARLVRRGPLPLYRGVTIVEQIADALQAAHEAGIVHRDLKPDNVLVCRPGSGPREIVKVLDFGLAKIAGQSRLTKKGMVFGTPHYMSPEQASGGVIDHRTDIYALGVVMYEIFTGRVPFEADTFMGVMTMHIYVQPTPPRQVEGLCDDIGRLEDVVLKCLEKKPEARYQSMTELIADLHQAARVSESGYVAVRPAVERAPRPVASVLAAAPRPSVPAASGGAPPSSALARPSLWLLVAVLIGLGAGGVYLFGGFAPSSDRRSEARTEPGDSPAGPALPEGRGRSSGSPPAAESGVSHSARAESRVQRPAGGAGGTTARSRRSDTRGVEPPGVRPRPSEPRGAPIAAPSTGHGTVSPGATSKAAPAGGAEVEPRQRTENNAQFSTGEIVDPWSQ